MGKKINTDQIKSKLSELIDYQSMYTKCPCGPLIDVHIHVTSEPYGQPVPSNVTYGRPNWAKVKCLATHFNTKTVVDIEQR